MALMPTDTKAIRNAAEKARAPEAEDIATRDFDEEIRRRLGIHERAVHARDLAAEGPERAAGEQMVIQAAKAVAAARDAAGRAGVLRGRNSLADAKAWAQEYTPAHASRISGWPEWMLGRVRGGE